MKTNIECKIYYAHSKQIYGTAREGEELGCIKRKYPEAEIINPALLVDISDMKKFLKIVKKCSQVVVSEFEGYLGRGVFAEIAMAFAYNIKVSVIRKTGSQYSLYPVTGIQVINEHDWKIKYAQLIVKY